MYQPFLHPNGWTLTVFIAVCTVWLLPFTIAADNWAGAQYYGQLVDGRNFDLVGPAFGPWTYEQGNTINGQRVPDQLSVYVTNRCVFSSSANNYWSYSEFVDGQGASVKISLDAPEKKFVGSASASWSQSQNMMNGESRSTSQVEALCSAWAVKLQTVYPGFNISFPLQIVINQLPNTTWTDDMYPIFEQFFLEFGGLVQTQGELGGRLAQYSYSSLEYSTSVGKSGTAQQANAAFWFSATLESQYKQQITQQFLASTVLEQLQVEGGLPWIPGVTNWTDWAQSIFVSGPAVPVVKTLVPLYDFLDVHRCPYVNPDSLPGIKANMIQGFKRYVLPPCAWNVTWEQPARNVVAQIQIDQVTGTSGTGVPTPPSVPMTFRQVVGPLVNGAGITLNWMTGPLSAGNWCNPDHRAKCAHGLFAYIVPNLIKLSCIRDAAGQIYAQVDQGDGGGPWMVWPNNCGGESNKKCVGCLMKGSVEHGGQCLNRGPVFGPMKGNLDRCYSNVDFRPGLIELVGYHSYDRESWFESYDIHVQFSCSLDTQDLPYPSNRR